MFDLWVSVARTATVKPPWMGLWRPSKRTSDDSMLICNSSLIE